MGADETPKKASLWELVKETYNEWSNDAAPRLAAALSYYTLFSLAPLLLMLVSVAGFFAQRKDVEKALMDQAKQLLGAAGASAVQSLVAASSNTTHGVWATALGLLLTVLGAISFFGQLQESLNVIWGVQLRPDLSWKVIVARRLYCFCLVIVGGILMLVAQIAAASIAVVTAYLQSKVESPPISQFVNFLVTVSFSSFLFAMLFYAVPDAVVHWSDVRTGALITGLLFSTCQLGLAFYLGKGGLSSTYGAAASMVVLLLWTYYSAQILFFGAEFTKVYALRRGRGITPRSHAILRQAAVVPAQAQA